MLKQLDTSVMAVVPLTDSSGEELCIKAEDDMLYEREINEGDQVYFDENNQLEKVLDRDWTKRLAKKYEIPCTLLCDTNHVISSDYSEVVIVGAGADAVDFKLPCGGWQGVFSVIHARIPII